VIAGAILAGGGATRFGGQPKGLQNVGGTRIIDRAATALRGTTSRILVVSADRDAGSWLEGAEVVEDVLPGRASAIGIHAALVNAQSSVLVIGWDMPFVPPALMAEIAARLRDNVAAVVPVGPDGPEAVCAGYSPLAIPVFETLIGKGVVKLSELIAALPNVMAVSGADLARFGDPRTIFFNVNRPEDRERAEAIARSL
jgi:molybdopterin-guanine dinucleotide biosynthesis protein A